MLLNKFTLFTILFFLLSVEICNANLNAQRRRPSLSRQVSDVDALIKPKNAAFNTFVNTTLSWYHEFVALDPLAIEETFAFNISNSLFVINGSIWDNEYFGLNDWEIDTVSSDIANSRLDLRIRVPTARCHGKFNLSGIIASTKPFSGSGEFDLSLPQSLSHYGLILGYLNFDQIDGFVVIRNESPDFRFWFNNFNNGGVDPNSTFESLFDNSIDEELQKEISGNVGRHIVNEVLSSYIRQWLQVSILGYLQLSFDQLSLFDIISGVTIPPPTEPLSTTEPSCQNQISDEQLIAIFSQACAKESSESEVLQTELIHTPDGYIVEQVTKTRTFVKSIQD